jgi:hypothetical protein
MPRQNRVTPFGELIAVPERGTMMGNRGVLHDEQGQIQRLWAVKRWIACVLEFRGRYRRVMTPNRYTELFFLDEATALAAGHRPCAECRHERFLEFCEAWRQAHSKAKSGARPRADNIDNRLHADRLTPERTKRIYAADIADLPDGTFVTLPEDDTQPHLLWRKRLHVWSPGGYRASRPIRRDATALVLTPESAVAAIRTGFVPAVHPSAE